MSGSQYTQCISPVRWATVPTKTPSEPCWRTLWKQCVRLTISQIGIRIKRLKYLQGYRGRTIVGVLQMNFFINWYELESVGIEVENELKKTANKMKTYYDVLFSEFGGAHETGEVMKLLQTRNKDGQEENKAVAK
jgi:hypothetical protein